MPLREHRFTYAPLNSKQRSNLPILDSLSHVRCCLTISEGVRVSLDHELCDVDLLEGVSNAVGRREELWAILLAINISRITTCS
jgi:hypothetical protein